MNYRLPCRSNERGAARWAWIAMALLGVLLVACGTIYLRADTEFAETSGLVGLISAVAGGAFTLLLQVTQSMHRHRRAQHIKRQHLAAGDRFLAQNEFGAALREYEAAREALPDELLPQRRLVEARCRELAFEAFEKKGGVAYERGGGRPCHLVDKQKVEEAQRSLFYLQSRDPDLMDDVELLLLEALTYKVDRRHDRAVECLERARAKEPKNPRVLAELGLQKGMLASEPPAEDRALRLLEQAIELAPEEQLYRFYRARTLDRMDRLADALRAYSQLAERVPSIEGLLDGFALRQSLGDVFSRASERKWLGSKEWDVSTEEQLHALRILEATPHACRTDGEQKDLGFYRVTVERAAGRIDDAAARLAKMLIQDRRYWTHRKVWLATYLELLEQGARESTELSAAEAREALQPDIETA